MYRKEVSKTTTNRLDFVKLSKNNKLVVAKEKVKSSLNNDKIGFKHTSYSISENAGHVTVIIEKRVPEDITVWVRTIDDSAKNGEDYETKDELITIKAHEKERSY